MVKEQKLLRIYLNDHSAGAFLGIELAKRALSNNRETPLGDYLERFIDELQEDLDELVRVIETCDLPHDRYKRAAAWTAERVGRLKLNGQLTGYSPLSRVFELEGLIMGVTGKLELWRALQVLSETDPRLEVVDLDRLADRAEKQRSELENHHRDASRVAFLHSEVSS
jgi:hypothetical protein